MTIYALAALALIGILVGANKLSFFNYLEIVTLSILCAIGWVAMLAYHRVSKMSIGVGACVPRHGTTPYWAPQSAKLGMKDAGFGRVYESAGEWFLSLSSVLAIAQHDSRAEFTTKLKWLLEKLPSRAVVLAGREPDADLGVLLDKLDTDLINRIVVRARKSVKPHIRATLECSVQTDFGTIHVRSGWNASTPCAEACIVSMLLKPLAIHSLFDRLVLEEKGKAHPLPGNYQDIIKELFRIAGTPCGAGAADQVRIAEHVRVLSKAQRQARGPCVYGPVLC